MTPMIAEPKSDPQRSRPDKPSTPAARQGVRLSKLVAAALGCSRREAEQYIEGGFVQVGGQLVEEPMHRALDGQPVDIDPHASLTALHPVTLLLHKPPGYDAVAPLDAANSRLKPALQLLTAATHVANDETEMRVLKRHFQRLDAPVPLETGAGGLIVFTQDWRVARKLAEDASIIEQEIIVEVAGEVPPESLHRLNQPRSSNGKPLPVVKVSVNSSAERSSKLRFAFKGIHLGLVAYLCEQAGLQILSMKRLRIGRVNMAQLPIGQWRYLQPHERF